MSVPFAALTPALAQDAGDAPDSVARIAEVSGTVSFHPAGVQDWQAASLNYPVTSGSGVWAEPRSHASVDINGARIHLDGESDLEITNIDPQAVTLSVPQGAVFVHVYPGVTGQAYEIDTPHGAAHIAQPGQYEIEAGDDQHPMTLSVFEGAAQMVGQSANVTVQQGQRGVINPDNSSTTAAAQPDDFVRTVQTAEQPYANTQQTAQYVSPAETGYQDLARYGQWQTAPQYGAVWYPQQVAADWAPYRNGHWAYVAPWGYTWVDDAPWGFTPFHYGRWVQVGERWGWVPGDRVERPVYAPALVSFFGNIGGVGIDLSVGWVPLAPEEVYVPPYRYSQRYAHDINIVNVHNQTKIVNVTNRVTVVNYNNYANRRGATVVDRQTLANSRAVAPAFRNQPKGNDQRWAQAKPVAQVAVKPQAVNRPGNAPKFDAHHTSNAQFAAKNEQGRPNSANGKPQFTAQPQNNQGKPSNANGKPQFSAQQNGQGKPSYSNGKPQYNAQQNGQRPKNAAPGPTIKPQSKGTFTANGKQQSQGQPKAQQKNVQKPKNAAPGPVIVPQNAPGNGQQSQSNQSKAQFQAQQKASQPATASSGAAAAPTWKQTKPAGTPNQVPASQTTQQTNAKPSSQLGNQKAAIRNTQGQPQLVPMASQTKAQPTKPAAKQVAKPDWNKNQQNQSNQTRNQSQPQGKAQSQSKAQSNPQAKPQAKPQPSTAQSCNPKNSACTQ